MKPKSMRRWFRLARYVLAGSAAVIMVQVVYFVWIIARIQRHQVLSGGVVVVYAGEPSRITGGFRVAETVTARYLVFSGGTGEIRGYRRQHGIPHGCAVHVVDGTYTTDQNARQSIPVVKSLLRGSDSKSVLLVTSWYHMPRAYFLTRLYAIGSGISWNYVAAEPVPAGWSGTEDSACELLRMSQLWKRPELRSELLRFWGSIFRVGLSLIGIENWPRPAGMPKAPGLRDAGQLAT